MEGSTAPFPTLVKLYILFWKNWQVEVAMACFPIRKREKKNVTFGHVKVFDEIGGKTLLIKAYSVKLKRLYSKTVLLIKGLLCV